MTETTMREDEDVPDDDAWTSISTGVILRPRFAFGATAKHPKCATMLAGGVLATLLGRHVRLCSLATKTTKFLEVTEPTVVETLAIVAAPSGKYCALLQRAAQPDSKEVIHQVAIFNLKVSKLVRTIRPPKNLTESTTIVDASFSEGSKSLVVVYGKPDPVVVTYRWYLDRVIGSVKLERSVVCCQFAASADTQLIAVTPTSVHHLTQDLKNATYSSRTLQESSVKVHWRYTCLGCAMGYTLVGDSNGCVHLFLENKLVGKVEVLAPVSDDDNDADRGGDAEPGFGREAIVGLVPIGRGFAAAAAGGWVALFGAAEGPGAREKIFSLRETLDCNLEGRSLVGICTSAAGDMVAVVDDANRVLTLDIAAMANEAELNHVIGSLHPEEEENRPFSLMHMGGHSGAIHGMDASLSGSTVATIGHDHTVRVWDAQLQDCVVSKAMLDDLRCVAVHPLGGMVLVGMHDKVRLFLILWHELDLLAEFPTAKADAVAFSRSGHMFAAVGKGSTISVFSTQTHECIARLKGHVSTVTAMAWSAADAILLSTSSGGATYFWDVGKQQRIKDCDYVDKTSNFQAIASLAGSGMAVVRNTVGDVRLVHDGRVVHSARSTKGESLPVVAIGDERVLLAGTNTGFVSSFPWPRDFPAAVAFQEAAPVAAHCGPVSHMKLCGGGTLLVTASNDGCIIVWSVQAVVAGALVDASWTPPPRPSLRLHIDTYSRVIDKLRELAMVAIKADGEARAKYMMRAKELKDRAAELETTVDALAKEVDRKSDELQLQRDLAEKEKAALLKDLEMSHLSAAEEQEATFDKRMALEVKKFELLKAEKDDMQFKLEESMVRQTTKHQEELAKATADLSKRVAAEVAHRKAAWKAKQDAEHEFMHVLEQTEDDFDDNADRMQRKLESYKTDMRAQLDETKAQIHILTRENLRLKGDKLTDLKRITAMNKEINQLRSTCNSQKFAVEDLSRELQQQRSAADGNMLIMDEMRKRMNDLDQHKFVMQDRATRLEQEVQPRRQEVEKLSNDRRVQDEELNRTLRRVETLSKAIKERETHVSNMKAELLSERAKTRKAQSVIEQMKDDLFGAMQRSDECALGKLSERTKALRKIVKVWLAGKGEKDVSVTDAEVVTELRRQVMATELKAELTDFQIQRVQSHATGRVQRKVAENAGLLHEQAQLRRENKDLKEQLFEARTAVHDLKEQVVLLRAWADKGGLAVPSGSLDQAMLRELVSQQEQSNEPTDGSCGPARRATSAGSSSQAVHGFSSLAGRASLTRPSSSTFSSRASSALTRPASPSAHEPRQQCPRGSLAKGSPARMLQELMGEERERVAALLSELEASNGVIERQQSEINMLRGMLPARLLDEAELQADEIIYQHDDSEDSGEDGRHEAARRRAPQSSQRPRSASTRASRPVSGAAAARRARPLSAVPEYPHGAGSAGAVGSRPWSARSSARA